MILVAPNPRSIPNVNQFRAYNEALAKLLNSAHHHCADSERTTDLSGVDIHAFVTKHSTACYHFQLREKRKAIHDAFSYPVRKVLHIQIITGIKERKHRKRVYPFVVVLILQFYHLGDKAIAATGNSFYIPGTLRGLTKSLS